MKTITPQRIYLFIRDYNIATNPAPEAIFDPLVSGFNVWATPNDHPAGKEWEQAAEYMDQGAYTKKCAFVGTAFWNSHEGVLEIDTDAYILHDRLGMKNISNRPDDIAWLLTKINWVFREMGIRVPKIRIAEER